MEGPAMIKILYEDNHLLVAVKPKGILSQADGSKKEDMLTILKVYLKEKYQKPGNVYLGCILNVSYLIFWILMTSIPPYPSAFTVYCF